MTEHPPSFHSQRDPREGLSIRCRRCRELVCRVTDERRVSLDPQQLAAECRRAAVEHRCGEAS